MERIFCSAYLQRSPAWVSPWCWYDSWSKLLMDLATGSVSVTATSLIPRFRMLRLINPIRCRCPHCDSDRNNLDADGPWYGGVCCHFSPPPFQLQHSIPSNKCLI